MKRKMKLLKCKICFKNIREGNFKSIFFPSLICDNCLKEMNPIFKYFKVDNKYNALAIYEYNDKIRKMLYDLKGVYDYELAKCFLDENKAMLSVILLEGCWAYSYITSYYGFNPDVILLSIIPAIAFYFYNCMKDNKTSDWIKLGLIVGISFLNKYQTALILLPMAIWALMFKRDVFKNKFFF